MSNICSSCYAERHMLKPTEDAQELPTNVLFVRIAPFLAPTDTGAANGMAGLVCFPAYEDAHAQVEAVTVVPRCQEECEFYFYHESGHGVKSKCHEQC